MAEAGKRLRRVIRRLLPKVKPGVTTAEVDQWADELIIREGGEAGFKRVPNYYWATCLPVNEQAVHTPPGKRALKNGDILTIDTGLYLQGFHTDFSTTFIVGKNPDKEIQRFLEVGKETLDEALKQVKNGNYLGQISQVIQKGIEVNGYKILKNLTGHGIGRDLHEDPFVLQFLERSIDETYRMRPGLVIAVEVIYSQSSEKIVYEKDSEWSTTSADGSFAACFEHTIAITANGSKLLT